MAKMERPAIILFFDDFLMISCQCGKSKIVLKPLVGARFWSDSATASRDTILAPSFSLSEKQNYVKIVTSLE